MQAAIVRRSSGITHGLVFAVSYAGVARLSR